MILDLLGKKISEIACELGYNEYLRVIKSNRPDLCDYQCDGVFKLAKSYHKSPVEIGEEIVFKINNIKIIVKK